VQHANNTIQGIMGIAGCDAASVDAHLQVADPQVDSTRSVDSLQVESKVAVDRTPTRRRRRDLVAQVYWFTQNRTNGPFELVTTGQHFRLG
jgi:hypothetical protein